MTHNSWKRALLADPTGPGDLAIASLHELMSSGDEDTDVNALRGEEDTVFLARHPEGTLVFMHHVRVFGGTRVRPEASIFALVGTGPRAYPVKFEPRAFSAATDVFTPTWSNLKDLNSFEAVRDAVVGASRAG